MYGLKKKNDYPWHVTNSNDTTDGQEEDNLTLPQAAVSSIQRQISLTLPPSPYYGF